MIFSRRNALCAALAIALFAAPRVLLPEQPKAPDARLVVDWTRADQLVNRPLFSTQGFMQIATHPNPQVLDTFRLLNPMGTQTRLETYIHQMEPENDNDDPNVFNWQKFDTRRMIRFIDDVAAFEQLYHGELGMEPLVLLCYTVPWLETKKKGAVSDVEEWAEFAAAVVETYNGRGDDYRLKLRYVQVWNEPNMDMFFSGTQEEYFKLFNAVADRIHRDYPGVMVGGPTITHSGHVPKEWMDNFFRECGHNADFAIFHHYGPQGQGTKPLTDAVRRYAQQMRAIPGKETARIMITETDAWFDGWEKIKFVMDRQFAFLELSDLLLGVHHFCCLAYNEAGNYTFGIVDEQGGAIDGTFWPYWAFRNTIGDLVYTHTEGTAAAHLKSVASRHTLHGDTLYSAVLYNQSDKPIDAQAIMFLPSSRFDQVLVADRIGQDLKGPESARIVEAGSTRLTHTVTLQPGDTVALRLQGTERQHFPFADLNNQMSPWVGLRASAGKIGLHETRTVTARVFNSTAANVSGRLVPEDFPQGWAIEIADGDPAIANLSLGESRTVTWKVTAATLTNDEYVGGRVVLRSDAGEQIGTSIPVSFEAVRPARFYALPQPVQAIAGEENQVDIQITSGVPETLEGTFELRLPDGITPLDFPARFSVEGNGMARHGFRFEIPPEMKQGRYTGNVHLQYLGTHTTVPFTIVVEDDLGAQRAVPVDVAAHLNFDPLVFWHNRTDYDKDMGMFLYPADYVPGNREVRIAGVPFRMPAVNDGAKSAILARGQEIAIPEGRYRRIALLGFGHDGKHPGAFTVGYGDGTTEPIQSEIPEWCLDAPPGSFKAIEAPARYTEGGLAPPATNMLVWFLQVDNTREVKSLTLPTFDRAAYIFAVTALAE